MGAISDFVRGIGHGLAGLHLLVTRRKMWPLVAWPFFVALAALAGLVVAAVALRDRWLAILPGGALAHSVLEVLAYVVLAIVCWFVYLPLAVLIAGPWNEAISEATEAIATGTEKAGSHGSYFAELG